MKYDLSAVTMLKILGYDQPTGREWLIKHLRVFRTHSMTSYRK